MKMNSRIVGALFVGVLMVTASYYAKADDKPVEGTVTVVTTPTPEREYIAPVDSDGDGVSDWEEILADTRIDLTSLTSSSTDYKGPQTLTQQFGIDLFENYVRSEGYGPFGASQDELISGLSNNLVRQTQDVLFTQSDIIVGTDDSSEAIKLYANQVATIVMNGKGSERSEISIVEEAVRYKNEETLAELDPIIVSYGMYLEETKKLTVPPSYASAHLDLVNVYQAMLSTLSAMRSAFTDPLLTLIRIKRYPDDAAGLYYAYNNMYLQLQDDGIVFSDEDPGRLFNLLDLLE